MIGLLYTKRREMATGVGRRVLNDFRSRTQAKQQLLQLPPRGKLSPKVTDEGAQRQQTDFLPYAAIGPSAPSTIINTFASSPVFASMYTMYVCCWYVPVTS